MQFNWVGVETEGEGVDVSSLSSDHVASWQGRKLEMKEGRLEQPLQRTGERNDWKIS